MKELVCKEILELHHWGSEVAQKNLVIWNCSLQKQPFLLAPRRWGRFASPPAAMSQEKRLPFAGWWNWSAQFQRFRSWSFSLFLITKAHADRFSVELLTVHSGTSSQSVRCVFFILPTGMTYTLIWVCEILTGWAELPVLYIKKGSYSIYQAFFLQALKTVHSSFSRPFCF